MRLIQGEPVYILTTFVVLVYWPISTVRKFQNVINQSTPN